MRQRIVKILKPLHAVSVENSCGSGTPDINYIGGWIECKCVNTWPKNPSAIVKIPHFTPQQRLWIKKRLQAGGVVQVILKVGRDWVLLPEYSDVANNLGRSWTKEDILKASNSWHWENKLEEKSFLSYFWTGPMSEEEEQELRISRNAFEDDLAFRTGSY
jgi:hypothetical protein